MPRRFSFAQLALRQQPLFYLSLILIAGLAAGAKSALPPACWLLPAVTGWLVATLFLLRRGGGAPILFAATLFLVGGALSTLERHSVSPQRVKRLIESGAIRRDEPVEIWGQLVALPELAPDRIHLLIAVERIATEGRELSAAGSVQAIVPQIDNEERREYDRLMIGAGVQLRIYCHLRRTAGFRNPGAPSFDQWLDDRDLDATAIVKSPLLIEKTGEITPNPLFSRLYHLRARAISTILSRIAMPGSGLLVAALFGNRHFIDRRLGESFRAGGTFHLLVISGLHVGLMAAFMLWLTMRLRRRALSRFALVMTTIWAYVLMVGAQPAVNRAAWMLSGVLLARLIYRSSSGPNMLAAAATIILAARPRELFNPAFQLSFLTVAVIVLFSLPLCERLKRIGAWQPNEATPYPPRVNNALKRAAEALYWNDADFRRELSSSRIRYRLDKSPLARRLGALRLQPPCAWILATLISTVAVQIGLLPVMIAYFHRISPGSPLANIVEGGLVFLLMALGVLFLLAEWLAPFLSNILILMTEYTGRLIIRSSLRLAEWPAANLYIPDGGAVQIALYVIFFALFARLIVMLDGWEPFDLRARRNSRIQMMKPLIAAASFLIVLGLLLLLPFSHDYERGRLKLTFLDVGQGDAIAVLFPQGKTMLIDSGGRPSFDRGEILEGAGGAQDENLERAFIEDRPGIAELAVAPFLWHLGLRRLDYIVASHGHADHVEGFSSIVRDFGVGLSIQGASSVADDSGDSGDSANTADTVNSADPFPPEVARRGIERRIWQRGDRIETDGVTIEVLAPFADSGAQKLSTNDRSLVLRFRYGARSFLLTGDIERALEARLASLGDDLRADVLKVAHHGSRTSSTRAFLERVRASYAVISVAAPSPFGHPHREALERIEATGARILTTSDCGAITFSTDGEDLRLETFTKCERDAQSAGSGGHSSRGR